MELFDNIYLHNKLLEIALDETVPKEDRIHALELTLKPINDSNRKQIEHFLDQHNR